MADSQIAATPVSVLLCGTASCSLFASSLSKALDAEVQFVSNLQVGCNPDLVIGTYSKDSLPPRKYFEQWMRAAKVATLTVEAGPDEVIIGPLTVSGQAGCGYCAHARRAGASAASQKESGGLNCTLDITAAQVIARELQPGLRSNFEKSNLLNCVVVYRYETQRTSRHHIVPLPWCPVCGGAARLPRPAQAPLPLSIDDDPESLLRALAGWVDARTGVISSIQFELPENDNCVPIITTAAPPHVLCEDDSLRRLPVGWGKGLTLSEAILSAVGEAIERYSASLPDPDRVVWKRCDQLDGEFLDPRDFTLYSDAQYERLDFPFARFDAEITQPWVRGVWAYDGSPVWVPALSVFLSMPAGPKQQFSQGTSNGLAASSTPEDAALRAILELVERDAFMSAWLTGAAADRIVLDDMLPHELEQVLETIEGLGATVELYTLPNSALGTAAMCFAFGDGTCYPGVTLGLAAALDPLHAVRQAILELAQTGPHLRRMMQLGRLTSPATPEGVHEMLDHAAYYFLPERAVCFDALRIGGVGSSLRDLIGSSRVSAHSLEGCAKELHSRGIQVALVDVSSPDVRIGPFHVMRAVSPDLQPISYGYGLDFQPVPRIRELGLRSDSAPIHPIW